MNPVWQAGKYGYVYLMVGRRNVATVGWSTSRGEKYVATVHVPYPLEKANFAEQADAKRWAEASVFSSLKELVAAFENRNAEAKA